MIRGESTTRATTTSCAPATGPLEVLGLGAGSPTGVVSRPDDAGHLGDRGPPPQGQICSLVSYDTTSTSKPPGAARRLRTPSIPGAPAPPGPYLRGQDGGVAAIRGLEEAQRELGDLVVEVRLPRAGQASTGSYEGEGYVILRHPETEVVERGLRRLVTLLRVDLAPVAE